MGVPHESQGPLARLRIADSCAYTNDGCTPTNRYPDSGLEKRRLQGGPGLAQTELPFVAAQWIGEF